jgi:hypothetical protein
MVTVAVTVTGGVRTEGFLRIRVKPYSEAFS